MENKELYEYRARLLDKILQTAAAFCAACRAIQNPRQPIEDGWNVHQVAAHVRDVDENVYGLRIRRTASEEYPTFTNFDAETWAAAHYNPAEPLEHILSGIESSVQANVAWLKAQPVTIWSRLSRHEIDGERTLQIWVERTLAHLAEHLETVEKAR
jgi:hypothetical protein